jgi:F-type H+-transporting ATPase subunit epsilon
MAGSLELEVDTPERQLVREQVEDVQLPGLDGYMGILPGHAPLVGQLGTGFLTFMSGSKRRYLAVDGGFLEIREDHVRVLADSAQAAEDIDVNRARAELKEAQDRLAKPDADPAAALHEVARAQARVEVAEKK